MIIIKIKNAAAPFQDFVVENSVMFCNTNVPSIDFRRKNQSFVCLTL